MTTGKTFGYTRRMRLPKDAAEKIRAIYRRQAGPTRPTPELEEKSGFNDKELDNLKMTFRYFDEDDNKYLDKIEMQKLFRYTLGNELPIDNLETVFGKMDQNRDNKISFPEFLVHNAQRKKPLPQGDYLRDTFEKFDRNEDGLLNLDDFRHALLYLGNEADRIDLRSVFVNHDSDKDGLIGRDEFIGLLHRHFTPPELGSTKTDR